MQPDRSSLGLSQHSAPHQHGIRKQLSCETQMISSIDDWSSSINMKRQTDVIVLDFNMSKCAVLSITTNSKPSIYDYVMNGEKIPRTGNHDYLGVTINSKLSWKPHINKVQSKASRTLELIKRTRHAASHPVRKTAYEALVRPTLEYAKCTWSPYTNIDTQRVERVQHDAARFIVGDYHRRLA